MSTRGWLAEDAYAELQRQLPLLRSIAGANEDTTRLRAINTILFDVLRWDKALTETERYVREEGYADYVCGTEPDYSLVLEAKREGVPFLLSEDIPSNRPVPFDLLARESRAAADALRQVIGYAVQLGVSYSAISNGHQWVLALTFVQGKPIDSRRVMAFTSLDRLCSDFRAFWNAFSPLALATHLPTPILLESRFDPAPPKLSTRITNYPQPAERNILRNELSTAIELLWAEVTQRDYDDAFLRYCYITPHDESDDCEFARQLIRDASHAPSVPESDPPGAAAIASLLRSGDTVRRRPVVILGRIGHGKSIFLQYLRRVGAAKELQNYIQIDINFVDRPNTAAEVPGYIFAETDRQLRDTYQVDVTADAFARAVLNLELQRFRLTTRAKVLENDSARLAEAEAQKIEELQRNQHEYFGHVFRHLRKGRDRALAMFFDNLDRQDDKIQEAAFLCASSIARDWDTLVFICLRPGTFQRSRADGVLDAVAPRYITIVPPRTDILLRRRFDYAAKLADAAVELAESTPSKVEVGKDELLKAKAFFEICEDSFRRTKDLAHLFASVSNGNARAILEHVQQVMRSGHLNTEKMFTIAAKQGYYLLAKHESLRALLFADHKQYDPNASLFLNLFDLEHAEPREHFSRLLALDYFARAAVGDRYYGYKRRVDAEAALHALGYTGPHILATLRTLYDGKCLEGRVLDVGFDEAGADTRITALGRYHATDLVRTFVYLDAIVVDTPVLDEKLRKRLDDVSDVAERLSRAREFLRYLNKCAQELHDANALSLWNDVHDAIERNITAIEHDT